MPIVSFFQDKSYTLFEVIRTPTSIKVRKITRKPRRPRRVWPETPETTEAET